MSLNAGARNTEEVLRIIPDFLSVYGLETPSIAESAIDNLVMEKSNKDLIQAIARTYTDGDQYKRFSADFIQGKGEGQIILLHGPPGTGKTLTAGKYFLDVYGMSLILTVARICCRVYQTTPTLDNRSGSWT